MENEISSLAPSMYVIITVFIHFDDNSVGLRDITYSGKYYERFGDVLDIKEIKGIEVTKVPASIKDSYCDSSPIEVGAFAAYSAADQVALVKGMQVVNVTLLQSINAGIMLFGCSLVKTNKECHDSGCNGGCGGNHQVEIK